ncbi:DUF3429 domain-containing protein [Aestuariibacter salexigens]|uniref:DUF3429 domain-containing protein n=1 Tax=Aestuariibacter salexigens TaxID=226010 RepID=UPI0003FE6845|nr:DUF3429 domain-containing protein [Aestuariibacter salexigens]
MTPTHSMLGYAGLIPFIGLPLLAVTNVLDPMQANQWFIAYSAVILSFFGGIHWLQSLRDDDRLRAALAMLPSIVAWCSQVFFSAITALLIMAAGYLLMWLYDKNTLPISASYMRLRGVLTATVCGCHIVMIGGLLANQG